MAKKKIEEKIATIGQFTKPKDPTEEVKKTEVPEKETKEVPEEETRGVPPVEEKLKLEGLTPEQIKERILKLVTEVASRGLSEEEKIKFIGDFEFWNGILFEILDIGNNLKGVLGQTSFTLTPGQALLTYLIGTGTLVVLLRPDLSAKLFKKKVEVKPVRKKEKKPKEKLEKKEKPEVEEKTEKKEIEEVIS